MSSYIDLTALWHVALLGALFGVGIVACSAFGMVGASRLAVARERRWGGIAAPAVLAAISFAVVAGALVFALYVLFNK